MSVERKYTREGGDDAPDMYTERRYIYMWVTRCQIDMEIRNRTGVFGILQILKGQVRLEYLSAKLN